MQGDIELKPSYSVKGILFPESVMDIPDDCSSDCSETAFEESHSSCVEASDKYSAAELEQMTADSAEYDDILFQKFKQSLKKCPKQVLRYQRGGLPLWVTDKNVPQTEAVPNCEKCGAERQFEFQVMPQLLNYLDVDVMEHSIDWATLAIYTCSADCNAGGQYGREFLLKQHY